MKEVVSGDDVRHSITSASEHRRLILDAMVALATGKLNVQQANALASLSAEVHKSIKMEFEMVCYAAENFALGSGNEVLLLGKGPQHRDV
jgi:hypothetical protein